MATQIEDDFTEIDEPVEEIEQDLDADVGEDADEDDGADSGEEENDVVGWGETAVTAEEETEGMRNLRNRLRELERENKTLKGAPKVEDVGPEPDMDEYWDKPEQYKADLLKWHEKQRAAEERETQQQAVARKQQERWEVQAQDLDSGYTELRVPGKDAARAAVEEQFTGEAFAYLVKAAGKNAPAFVYAIGNAPEKRAELKALADEGSWAEFIATAAVMATEVKMQKRKPGTAPEMNRSAAGASGGGVGSSGKTLERLEAEANSTGDRSRLIAYRRNLKEKKA